MGKANEIIREMGQITDSLNDFERKFADQSQDLDRNDKSAVRDEIVSMRKSIRGVEREIGGWQKPHPRNDRHGGYRNDRQDTRNDRQRDRSDNNRDYA